MTNFWDGFEKQAKKSAGLSAAKRALSNFSKKRPSSLNKLNPKVLSKQPNEVAEFLKSQEAARSASKYAAFVHGGYAMALKKSMAPAKNFVQGVTNVGRAAAEAAQSAVKVPAMATKNLVAPATKGYATETARSLAGTTLGSMKKNIMSI